ncbi:MAG: polysaccharide biosynthesis/export family protein [Candidatus Magnetoovum sp. WYHC-5]|nr:polysaccharide biosynthesis/export family protein [Candidatus Magnetoovum sp. WYHC-5]
MKQQFYLLLSVVHLLVWRYNTLWMFDRIKRLIIIVLSFVCVCCGNSIRENVTVMTAGEVEGMDFKPVELKRYTLGPGDIVEVTLWNDNTLNRKVQIDPDGRFIYPFIGEINAQGMTIADVYKKIQGVLSEYFKDPRLSVSIAGVSSQKVYVIGEVRAPGVYTLKAPLTILEVVTLAGGYTADAKLDNVYIIRGSRQSPTLIKVNLANILKRADVSQNIHLMAGDIVYLSPTVISDISRFAAHIGRLINPILQFEQGLRLAPIVIDSY